MYIDCRMNTSFAVIAYTLHGSSKSLFVILLRAIDEHLPPGNLALHKR